MESIEDINKKIYYCERCPGMASLPLPMYITENFKGIVFIARNPGVAKPEHGDFSNQTHLQRFEYNELIKRYEDGLKKSNVGRFYARILEKLNISFDSIAITNICKCATPENRMLNKDEINNCISHLKEQLHHIPHRKIIVFGGLAEEIMKKHFNYSFLVAPHPTYLEKYAHPSMRVLWVDTIVKYINEKGLGDYL
jgi:uracil-DNA glycosylase